MVTTKERPKLKIVRQSEFIASCDCDDFWRRKEHEQTKEEFLSRKARSRRLHVVGFDLRYGSVVVTTETKDRRGCRRHEVMLSRGDGGAFVCKHIIKALTSRALMPDLKFKTVVFTEKAARNLARMYAGKLRKKGKDPAVLVTTVNSVWVIGWQKKAKI